MLKREQHNIFHKDDIPGSNVGPIQGLVLQLYARGIIGVGVADTTKIGTGTERLALMEATSALPYQQRTYEMKWGTCLFMLLSIFIVV